MSSSLLISRTRTLAFGLCCLSVGVIGSLLVLSSRAWASACPNEALRTGPSASLPDCRAYEQVTPAYKNGGYFRLASGGFSGIGPNGTPSLTSQGWPTVDGLESDPGLEGAFYTFSRSASGWVGVADSLPASEYEWEGGFGLTGASLDGLTTLWYGRRFSQPKNSTEILTRRPGRVIEGVGPVTPPATPGGTVSELTKSLQISIVGMSNDASHILYESEPNKNLGFSLWPFDHTHHEGVSNNKTPSLYEFIGTGNTEPLLVGVDNNGTQIGACGTALGAGVNDRGSDNNAVSSDGRTIFMTVEYGKACAGVNEVYARIDNGEPGAHTVAISEPSKIEGSVAGDCEECDTEAAVRASAQFHGASLDGSKAFFTTTQPLLGKDKSTNIYEYDFDAPAGQKIVRVSGGDATVSGPVAEVQEVVQISEDGSHVYFTAKGVLTTIPNAQGQTAKSGASNLYLFERDAQYPAGRTLFIAEASVTRSNFDSLVSQSNVTPDGHFLLFLSSSPGLTPDDTSTVAQLFEYDAQTGSLTRVSIGQDGYNNNGNTSQAETGIVYPAYTGKSMPNGYWGSSSMSADGSYVFFESNDGLTPRAINDPAGPVSNVYEYHDGTVSLISDGQDVRENKEEQGKSEFFGAEASFRGTDASGVDVFFTTVDRLAPQDTDTSVDYYDARIDGGFAAAAPAVECSGDGCQGALSAAPVLLSPGSEFQAGALPILSSPTGGAKPAVRKKSAKKRSKAKVKRKRRGRKTSRTSRRVRGGRS